MRAYATRKEGSKRTRAKAAVAASCAALLALGAVMAALTATDTAVNKFELAEGLDVEVVEATWDESPDTDGDGVPDAAEGLLPTQEVAKDPKVQNSTGTEAYIFCEVEVPIRHVATANADGTPNDAADVELFSYSVNEGWTLMDTIEGDDSTTYRYAWDATLADGATGTLFDAVTYANVIDDGMDATDLLQELVVTGYGIQSLGFDGVNDAYEALFGPIVPAVTYTLTFDMGDTGIAQIDAIEIGEGKVATAPEAGDDIEEGYGFAFWSDETCTEEWDWSAPVMEDATIYVTVSAQPAQIVFETNGGVAVASIEGVTGQDLGTDDMPTTEIEGSDTYVFDAWYTSNGAVATAALTTDDEEDAWGHPVTSWAYFKYEMPAGTTVLSARYLDTTDTSKTAFAVFDSTDGSLSLYKRAASEVPSVGDTYDGHTASEVFPEEIYPTSPSSSIDVERGWAVSKSGTNHWAWKSIKTQIKAVNIVDSYTPLSMQYMFQNCSALESISGLDKLDCSKSISTAGMFYGCKKLTTLDLSSWDVSNSKNVSAMFSACTNLKSVNLNGWSLTATATANLFANCSSLTELDLSSWNMSKVSSIQSIFLNCSSLTELDLSSWDTSHASQIDAVFQGCTALEMLDISNWDFSNCESVDYTITLDCTNLRELNVSNIKGTSGIHYLWSHGISGSPAPTIEVLIADNMDLSQTSPEDMFKGMTNLRRASFSNCKLGSGSAQRMFYLCTSLSTLDLSNWDVSNVTDMQYMFYQCTNLGSVNLTGWDVSKVENMYGMFWLCSNLSVVTGIAGFNPTACANMSCMFSGCTSLATLDLSDWNTPNLTTMSYMFYNCTSLETLDLQTIDTSKVSDMSQMFADCSKLESVNLTGWDTSKVSNMLSLFKNCQRIKAINGIETINTTSTTNMSYMFYNCEVLVVDLSSWNVNKVSSTKHTDFATNAPGITEPNWVA